MVDEPFLTSDEVAAALSVTPQTIRNWIKKGVLPAERLGHVFRIRREDFEAFAGHAGSASASGGTDAEGPGKSAADVWAPGTAVLPRRRARRAHSVWDEESVALPRKRS